MERLVLDTNSLIQSLPVKSKYHDLWVSLFDGRNTFCVSNEILEEYEEILQRKTNHVLASRVISLILNNEFTSLVTPYFHFNLIEADTDDNKFVDCAVCGNAKFIVTEDHHFDILRQVSFPTVDILSLDEMMRHLESGDLL
ncbi:MAG: putative toxin-antitoxin system toxin component, PIN family [Muribaculaceae bacterium]|nr:putative toxin-antitoxin system toxin component, PIN family [Muribaculaceae bacterium]